MADKLVRIEKNCTTGEEIIVELTDAEIAERDKYIQDHNEQMAIREAEEQAKAELKKSAKAKLIAGEPLTEEEAATIVL
jgi:hypothetical protein